MVSSILNEFNNILNESAWMDSMSKAKAYEKVAQMDRKIGYSEVIFNDSALNQIFADVWIMMRKQCITQVQLTYLNSLNFEV